MNTLKKVALLFMLLFLYSAQAAQANQEPENLFQRVLKVADHALVNGFQERVFLWRNSPIEGCLDKTFPLQGKNRFPLGKIYYLPTIANSETCQQTFWYLKSSPLTNSSLPTQDGKYTTFTAPIAGRYQFKLWGTDESITLTVKDGTDGFEHYNYFPTRSLSFVGDEIWVVNNYRASLTRVNPRTMRKLGEIKTGQWPVAIANNANTGFPVVVQKAEDSIGFINPVTRRIEASLWVGDEPSNIVLSNDGQYAYVSLSTSGKVAVVDLFNRQVIKSIEVGPFPQAMAISPDNKKLYVGSYRSGTPSRVEYEPDPIEAEKDITIIDLETLTVDYTFIDFGNIIRSMAVSDDNKFLYVAVTQSFNDTAIFKPEEISFADEIIKVDLAGKNVISRIDLFRQSGVGLEEDAAFNFFGLTYKNDRLYFVSEAYENVIEIDARTMREIGRVDSSEGRPRALLIDEEDNIFVHNSQGFNLAKVTMTGGESASVKTTDDPRTAGMAYGQRYFTNTGIGVGIDRSCNTCHTDGEVDTLVWLNGAAGEPVLAKPLIWMEGTAPMTWNGNVTSIEGYALSGNASVGRKPTKEEFSGLYEYMSGVMAPPAANDWTERDGSMSEAALAGLEIFDRIGCRDCHSGEIYTDKNSYLDPEGIALSDTTTLVSTYRRGTWGKRGEEMTLKGSVARMARDWSKVTLSDEELDALTRYTAEITARKFFLLESVPAANEQAAAVDQPVRLELSHSIWKQKSNLEKVKLLAAGGAVVEADILVTRNELVIKPKELLAYDTNYTVKIDSSFEAYNELQLKDDLALNFKTAKRPTVILDPNRSYEWHIDFPHVDLTQPTGISPTHSAVITTPFTVTPTPSGIAIDVRYFDNETGSNIERVIGVIDGDRLRTGRIGVPAGPLALADTVGMQGNLIDEDGDGVAEAYALEVVNQDPPPPLPADDGTHIEEVVSDGDTKVLSTWFNEDATWRIKAKEVIEVPDDCQSIPNDFGVVNTIENGEFGISWDNGNGITFFITSPDSELEQDPGAPGGYRVLSGTTYWAVARNGFSPFNGVYFNSPLLVSDTSENVNDITEANGGVAGGFDPNQAGCYKITAIFHRGGFAFDRADNFFKVE